MSEVFHVDLHSNNIQQKFKATMDWPPRNSSFGMKHQSFRMFLHAFLESSEHSLSYDLFIAFSTNESSNKSNRFKNPEPLEGWTPRELTNKQIRRLEVSFLSMSKPFSADSIISLSPLENSTTRDLYTSPPLWDRWDFHPFGSPGLESFLDSSDGIPSHSVAQLTIDDPQVRKLQQNPDMTFWFIGILIVA